jgi:hypothetical protein
VISGPRGFRQKNLQNLDSINYPLTKAEPTHGVSTNRVFKFCEPDDRSHNSEIAHLPFSVLLSFHGLIGMASIAADRSAILVYVYPVLKASLLIKAAFRRSSIVNIDG